MRTVRIREHHDDRSELPDADDVVDSHAELLDRFCYEVLDSDSVADDTITTSCVILHDSDFDGLTNEQAILAIESDDSDGDGYSNLVEITDTANFGNTPTFPGYDSGNAGR